jgi:hypothetical protein
MVGRRRVSVGHSTRRWSGCAHIDGPIYAPSVGAGFGAGVGAGQWASSETEQEGPENDELRSPDGP